MIPNRKTLVLALWLMLAAGGLSVASDAPATLSQAEAPTLHIGPGDLIEVAVFDTPELSGKLRVSNSGAASFPLIGVLDVSGQTPHELETTIRQRLISGKFMNDPQVSVTIAEFANQTVSILGEVKKPGMVPVLGPRRLLDVISAAEGLTPAAGKVVTITHREHPDHPEVFNLAWSGNAALQPNPFVLPGDTIVVSRAGIVYVVGNVNKPGGFTMANDEHVSLLQAIALASGTAPGARLSDTRIIRSTPSGRQEVPVDLAKVLSGKADDIPLANDDIVFVPNSKSKMAIRRAAEAAVQITTGVLIYRR